MQGLIDISRDLAFTENDHFSFWVENTFRDKSVLGDYE